MRFIPIAVAFLFLMLVNFSMCCAQEEPDTSYWEEPDADTIYYDPGFESFEEDTTFLEFEDFINLFRASGPNVIPQAAVNEYIGANDEYNSDARYSPKELLMEGDYFLVVYVLFVPVGPGLEKIYIRTYNKEGTW